MKLFGKISYVFLLLFFIGCSSSDPPKDSSTKSLNQEDGSEDESIGSLKQKDRSTRSLKLGMTYDDVIDLIGHPSKIETPIDLKYSYLGDHLWYYEDSKETSDGVVRIYFDDQKIIKIELRERIYQLELEYKLLELGMTYDNVRDTLGLPYRVYDEDLDSNTGNIHIRIEMRSRDKLRPKDVRHPIWVYVGNPRKKRDDPSDNEFYLRILVQFSDDRVVDIEEEVRLYKKPN
ncbi:TPA: hypothetical protein EYN98_05780 [Candidatus Poribacteria bacterium]|nr:hypothetical protein [Candidatus Poribacteria bacterium]